MTGKCLCGKVGVKLNEEIQNVTVCYCDMCRKWGSGALFWLANRDLKSDFELIGQELLQDYQSSEIATRAFCKNCGTPVYYKYLATGNYTFCAGLFPDGKFQVEAVFSEEQCPPYLHGITVVESED